MPFVSQALAPLTLGRPAGIDPADNLALLTPVIQATPLRGRMAVLRQPGPKGWDFPLARSRAGPLQR